MHSDDPIVFDHVSKAFGARIVLEEQTFSVHKGERFVIIGPSGTGKSVSLKCASGQLLPTSGSVRILGQDLAQLSTSELTTLRRRIGYLFQSGALLGWKTLAENVALPLREGGGRPPADLDKRVHDALSEVGLGSSGDLYPSEASGGMVKRAAFARAIIGNPDILLFDEPTSGLDPVMSRTIDALIEQINTAHGTTCVVVTHDLIGALRYAHRIAFLKGGHFLEITTPERIFSSQVPEVQEFLAAQTMESPHEREH